MENPLWPKMDVDRVNSVDSTTGAIVPLGNNIDVTFFHELTHYFANTIDPEDAGPNTNIMEIARNVEQAYEPDNPNGLGLAYAQALMGAQRPRPPAPTVPPGAPPVDENYFLWHQTNRAMLKAGARTCLNYDISGLGWIDGNKKTHGEERCGTVIWNTAGPFGGHHVAACCLLWHSVQGQLLCLRNDWLDTNAGRMVPSN